MTDRGFVGFCMVTSETQERWLREERLSEMVHYKPYGSAGRSFLVKKTAESESQLLSGAAAESWRRFYFLLFPITESFIDCGEIIFFIQESC